MLDLDEIVEKLQDRNIKVVAKNINVHQNTLYRIMRKEHDNPKYEVLKKLSDYLEGKV